MKEPTKKLLEGLGNLLRTRKWTISTAESCTGGLVGNLITSVPGSSEYFVGGVVAYSDEVKKNLLSVSPETLKEFGAVSEETVREMACGIKELLGTDVGISVSGIAGPAGGSREKPVGTVAMGVDIPDKIITNIVYLKGERKRIKEMASKGVLEMLTNLLEDLK